MLVEMRVSQFALIEDLTLKFGPTECSQRGNRRGKSIVIGAINLLLGERAVTEQIRQCEDSALWRNFARPDSCAAEIALFLKSRYSCRRRAHRGPGNNAQRPQRGKSEREGGAHVFQRDRAAACRSARGPAPAAAAAGLPPELLDSFGGDVCASRHRVESLTGGGRS